MHTVCSEIHLTVQYVCVCAIMSVVWDPRPSSSITNVCLSAASPTSDTDTHTEMRSDCVMNVSAVCPLALHVVVCEYVHVRVHFTFILA